ncbi:transketolase family protein [Raineyella fluvialis]|uniref:Transketolase family protein n=1 Tax=Raineyella fluvialis TaxID=2662261 RepID=A0A5Q2FD85_9ACTN|nr:transketolase C-terminal domain-containing protein [Raineyella fluvialis]QGF23043.1 transketolase family protein [Raineyella fluvialis]
MSTTTATVTTPQRSAAMIASIADAGVPTTSAPFGHALNALAARDPRIVGLTADLAKYTDMHLFAAEYPDRFFEMGMAEQVMIGAAAGMAAVGLVPFASTYSVFATRRAYDFLCLDAAEPKLNVNIVAALPGLTTGYGPSHQATEDVAILRGMPDLTIFDPADAVDVEGIVPAAAAIEGPTYTRLLRGKVPRILDQYDYTFEVGKAKVVRPGDDAVIVSSGLMTMRALLAAEKLSSEHKVEVSVVHCATLKPFDEETVVAELDTDRAAFTAENHTVVGGLFETVAAALVKRGIGKKVGAIGLPDEFIDAGALPTLHDRYGLSTDSVVARVLAGLH